MKSIKSYILILTVLFILSCDRTIIEHPPELDTTLVTSNFAPIGAK